MKPQNHEETNNQNSINDPFINSLFQTYKPQKNNNPTDQIESINPYSVPTNSNTSAKPLSELTDAYFARPQHVMCNKNSTPGNFLPDITNWENQTIFCL